MLSNGGQILLVYFDATGLRDTRGMRTISVLLVYVPFVSVILGLILSLTLLAGSGYNQIDLFILLIIREGRGQYRLRLSTPASNGMSYFRYKYWVFFLCFEMFRTFYY